MAADANLKLVAVTDWLREPLREVAAFDSQISVVETSLDDLDKGVLQDADILYTLLVPEYVAASPIRLVHLISSGADHLRPALIPTGARVSTSRGANASSVADFVMAMLLGWQRRTLDLRDWQRSRDWPPEHERTRRFVSRLDFPGATMAIVGYGLVGRRVARLASAFGFRITAVNTDGQRKAVESPFSDEGDPACDLPEELFSLAELDEAVRAADVVCVCLPLNKKTKGLIDWRVFTAMQRSPFFIDVSRGGVCEHSALLRALDRDLIAGAALDVFPEEPLAPEAPVWDAPRVVMSPHVAAHSGLYERRAAEILIDNVDRMLAEQPLHNEVHLFS